MKITQITKIATDKTRFNNLPDYIGFGNGTGTGHIFCNA